MKSINITQAFEQIQEKRMKPWSGEEEVRVAWIKAIELATGLHLNAERGRKDASLNHVVVEFKAPGFFNGKKNSPKFIEATEQRLLPYIIKESQTTGIEASDFIGIAIDGEHICFAQVIDGSIKPQQLIPFSEYAVGMVVDAFKSDTRRALTTENLLADFGHGSLNARTLMQCLSDGLAYETNKPGNNKIKMLFEEWRTLFGQVADMSVLQTESIAKEMAFTWSGKDTDSLSARLFVIHTYNSLLIKLIAAEIVSSHGLTTIEYPAQSMSVIQNDQSLICSLEHDVERSNIFEQAGIKGFVEEAIFSWYLDVAKNNQQYSKPLLVSLRNVLSVLSLYRLDQLTHTRDVLRDLYQGLVPGKLRQSLGEFYTADWLVDFTLAKAKQDSWLDKRALDPTCGSGAFIISLIRQKISEAKADGWNNKKILDHICSTVWGFDLNPLAVQTARVNFLIEIAALLKSCPGEVIELPILLADAIYSPAHKPKEDEKVVQYRIGSQVAKLDILLPSELALNRERLDLVFSQMGDDVENDLEFVDVKNHLIKYGLISDEEMIEWEEPLSYTYEQVLNLHRQQWNGIWFRIVRNFFWSATAGEFDCIVGNPPWVRWSKLPEAYRERVKPTCEDYGIFSKTKRHGGNELDISAMITYTVSDKWLKNGGCLAFIVTGTLFKNPSSAGFRTFKLEPSNPDSAYLQPIEIDDFKALKPFEDASNHTVVSVFKKATSEGLYPVPYSLWAAKKGEKKAIPSSLNVSEVLNTIISENKEAFPVSELGSPWAILKPGRFETIKYLSAECSWTQGRKGITTDLNGVYFVPILQDNGKLVEIRSRPEAGRKDIGVARTQWIEPSMLYPLIKGASDFEACYLKILAPNYNKERLYTFVPNLSISNTAYQDCEAEINSPNLKKTKAWFKGFESTLLNRSTYRLQMKGAPYQAVYNVGEYTFQPWKVVWPEMSSSFYAAVVGSDVMPVNGERVFIPDHKVYFASFDDKETAYYLCGLLNTETVREWLDSHNVSIQVANVFKHLTLPEYDEKNKRHVKLSNLVEKTHNTHDKKTRTKVLQDVFTLAESILSDWSNELSLGG
mgnify:FL=1